MAHPVLGLERRRDPRRRSRPAGDAVEPVPTRPGVGAHAGAGHRRQRRDRRRLRRPLLLGYRDLRRAVPRLHQPRHRPQAAAIPVEHVAHRAPASGRPQQQGCALPLAHDQRRGGVGVLRRRHGPVPHQRGDHVRPQAVPRRDRRHLLPRRRGRGDARRDGTHVGRPRLLRDERREGVSTSTASPAPTSTPPWSTTTCTRT